MRQVEREKVRTRRGRALRRIAAAAVVTALCLGPGGYRILPQQVRHEAEAYYGIRGTQVVAWLEPYDLTARYLAANDGALLWMNTTFRLWGGWVAGSFGGCRKIVDCSHAAPLYGGVDVLYWSQLAGQSGWAYTLCVFGRIDDPAGETVRISLSYEEGEGRVTLLEEELPRAEWIQAKDGRTYFLQELRTESIAPQSITVGGWMELLDGEGRALYRTWL